MAVIALNLPRKPADLVTLAKRITIGMGEHASQFVTPPLTMAELNTRLDSLISAIAAAEDGGKTSRLELQEAVKDMKNALRLLAAYVYQVSEGNASIINMAGMDTKKQGPGIIPEVFAPENVRTHYTRNRGEVKLLWNSIRNANNYTVQMTETPDAENSWKTVANPSRSSFLIRGLVSKSQIYLRVSTNAAAGSSGWSEMVSKVVP
jgi:hypothetical protein